MQQRDRQTIVAIIIAAGLLLAGFGGCRLLGPDPKYETATIEIVVSGVNATQSLAARAITQTTAPDAIDSIVFSISGEDKYGVERDPLATGELTKSGDVWSASIPDLPLGPPLTFTLEAYDGPTLIYTGSTTTTLSTSNLQVPIVLTPYDDGQAIAFPVIRRIVRPEEIVQGTQTEVLVTVEGSSNETLIVEITSGGGTFSPASPVDVPLSSGAATLELIYDAPESPSTYEHLVRVENEQGNAVEREFSTVVVWQTTGGSGLSIGGVAPAVVGIEMDRDGSRIEIAATVTDDGPSEELAFDWSFQQSGGQPASLLDPNENPVILDGYAETTAGIVQLTVTDGDTSANPEGLSTTVEIEIAAGLFPDAVEEPTPSTRDLEQRLVASDGMADNTFGEAVWGSGDTAIVGASSESESGTASGAAYVFRRFQSNWYEEQKLTASDPAPFDRFGQSVSVSGNTAVVGSPEDDDLGSFSGSAYVFTRNGISWTERTKLTASDGDEDDYFGGSVAIDEDVIVVGAVGQWPGGYLSGAVYVYRFDGTEWNEEAKLAASDTDSIYQFGTAVAISGDTILVGASGVPAGPEPADLYAGAAYIYRFQDGAWIEEQKITAFDRAPGDFFGISVALDDGTAVIGAEKQDGPEDSGAVYVFARNGSAWTLQSKLEPPDTAAGDRFGSSVSVWANVVVVGADGDDDRSGSAYVYRREGELWDLEEKLVAADPASGSFFGASVAIADGDVLVGAAGEDDFRGAVYTGEL